MDQERQDFKNLNDNARELLPQMSDQDLVRYIDHRRSSANPPL
jgi:hypothetical protein